MVHGKIICSGALMNIGFDAVQAYHVLQASVRRNSGYLARQEIERIISKICSDAKRLEPFGFKVYSQGDEDGILQEIFRRLKITNGIFCEIGVENGLECNTLYLLHQGWRGCWLEGNSAQRDAIHQKFRNLIESGRLNVGIAYVRPDNVNELMSAAGLCNDIDFMSIDIDGSDIYILEALNFSPKVICIEYNAKFPAHISKKPVYNPSYTWAGGDYMGASLSALNECAVRKGYVLVGTNIVGTNAFFCSQ